MQRRRPRARPRRRPRPASSRGAARRSTCAWSAAHQLGAALLYFTGCKGHNIKLRQRALARGLTLNEYALCRDRGRQGHRERDRGGRSTPRSACPSSRPCCARTPARSRPPRTARCRARSAPLIGDFHVHTTVSGDGALAARGGRRGGARARLPRARDHRSRRGHALRRRPRGAARAARADPRAAGRARRLAHAAARRRAQHRPERRARLRPRVPRAASTGASRRCTTTSSSTAPRRPGASSRAMQDPTRAHDRPPLGAHDRRAARRSISISTRSSPPPKRPAPRSRSTARCRGSTCPSRRCAARATATSRSC